MRFTPVAFLCCGLSFTKPTCAIEPQTPGHLGDAFFGDAR
jgi:hypothetical protein